MTVATGPVLIELCRVFQEHPEWLRDISDADLYDEIVFAVRLRYSRESFMARPAPEFDATAELVLQRLSTGWFADRGISSPQAWYSRTGVPGTLAIVNGEIGSILDNKPRHALWTASYLPNGDSAWQQLERIEFGDRDRRIYSLHFSACDTVVYTIDSISDYRRLVLRYPRLLGEGRLGVDWESAAHDVHAVRLTARGLTTAHDTDITTEHGTATLTGWDSESTAWLRLPADWTIRPNLNPQEATREPGLG